MPKIINIGIITFIPEGMFPEEMPEPEEPMNPAFADINQAMP